MIMYEEVHVFTCDQDKTIKVRAVGKGLIELGLEPFHTVAILGHNDPAWHIRCDYIKNVHLLFVFPLFPSNLAAIHAGGFSTGIYQTNTAGACQYIAEDSRFIYNCYIYYFIYYILKYCIII